jgi:hypothetical protein
VRTMQAAYGHLMEGRNPLSLPKPLENGQ